MSEFYYKIYELTSKIPYGKVTTYGALAFMAGHPHAARAVGQAMKHCPDNLPYHRVVKSDGRITGGEYAHIRRTRLQKENVPFLADGRVDIKKCIWQPDE